MLCSALVDATTAEAWTTTPKSASYHPSPRSAISARASTTWLPTAQSKHSSPLWGLRENHPPRKETRRSTVTWRHPTWALIKKKLGTIDAGEAQRPIKLLWWRDGTSDPHPPIEAAFGTTSGLKKKMLMKNCFFVIWCNTQEYCCIIALRRFSNCLTHCCSLKGLRL